MMETHHPYEESERDTRLARARTLHEVVNSEKDTDCVDHVVGMERGESDPNGNRNVLDGVKEEDNVSSEEEPRGEPVTAKTLCPLSTEMGEGAGTLSSVKLSSTDVISNTIRVPSGSRRVEKVVEPAVDLDVDQEDVQMTRSGRHEVGADPVRVKTLCPLSQVMGEGAGTLGSSVNVMTSMTTTPARSSGADGDVEESEPATEMERGRSRTRRKRIQRSVRTARSRRGSTGEDPVKAKTLRPLSKVKGEGAGMQSSSSEVITDMMTEPVRSMRAAGDVEESKPVTEERKSSSEFRRQRRAQSGCGVDWARDSVDPKWTPRARSGQRRAARSISTRRRVPAPASTLCPPRTMAGAERGIPRRSAGTKLADVVTNSARTGVSGLEATGADNKEELGGGCLLYKRSVPFTSPEYVLKCKSTNNNSPHGKNRAQFHYKLRRHSKQVQKKRSATTTANKNEREARPSGSRAEASGVDGEMSQSHVVKTLRELNRVEFNRKVISETPLREREMSDLRNADTSLDENSEVRALEPEPEKSVRDAVRKGLWENGVLDIRSQVSQTQESEDGTPDSSRLIIDESSRRSSLIPNEYVVEEDLLGEDKEEKMEMSDDGEEEEDDGDKKVTKCRVAVPRMTPESIRNARKQLKKEGEDRVRNRVKTKAERKQSITDSEQEMSAVESGDGDGTAELIELHMRKVKREYEEQRKDGLHRVNRTVYECRKCDWSSHVRKQVGVHLYKEHKISAGFDDEKKKKSKKIQKPEEGVKTPNASPRKDKTVKRKTPLVKSTQKRKRDGREMEEVKTPTNGREKEKKKENLTAYEKLQALFGEDDSDEETSQPPAKKLMSAVEPGDGDTPAKKLMTNNPQLQNDLVAQISKLQRQLGTAQQERDDALSVAATNDVRRQKVVEEKEKCEQNWNDLVAKFEEKQKLTKEKAREDKKKIAKLEKEVEDLKSELEKWKTLGRTQSVSMSQMSAEMVKMEGRLKRWQKNEQCKEWVAGACNKPAGSCKFAHRLMPDGYQIMAKEAEEIGPDAQGGAGPGGNGGSGGKSANHKADKTENKAESRTVKRSPKFDRPCHYWTDEGKECDFGGKCKYIHEEGKENTVKRGDAGKKKEERNKGKPDGKKKENVEKQKEEGNSSTENRASPFLQGISQNAGQLVPYSNMAGGFLNMTSQVPQVPQGLSGYPLTNAIHGMLADQRWMEEKRRMLMGGMSGMGGMMGYQFPPVDQMMVENRTDVDPLQFFRNGQRQLREQREESRDIRDSIKENPKSRSFPQMTEPWMSVEARETLIRLMDKAAKGPLQWQEQLVKDQVMEMMERACHGGTQERIYIEMKLRGLNKDQ